MYDYYLFPSHSRTKIICMIITSFPLALFFSILLYSLTLTLSDAHPHDSCDLASRQVPSGRGWGTRALFLFYTLSIFFFLFSRCADVNRSHGFQNKGMHIYFHYFLTSLHYYYYRVSTNITFINYFYEFVLLFVLSCIIIYHYSR